MNLSINGKVKQVLPDPAFELRQRFLNVVEKCWIMNNHSLKDLRCVYVIIGYDLDTKSRGLFYVGSTTKLNSRYKSHKIPLKVQGLGLINILYYLPMEKGFYDYEIKLINKLSPFFNKQHK